MSYSLNTPKVGESPLSKHLAEWMRTHNLNDGEAATRLNMARVTVRSLRLGLQKEYTHEILHGLAKGWKVSPSFVYQLGGYIEPQTDDAWTAGLVANLSKLKDPDKREMAERMLRALAE